MDKKINAEGTHILAVPYPSQGHINPMLQFCKRLVSKGTKATLAITNFISKSMSPKSDTVSIDTISDGCDEGGFSQAEDVSDYITRMKIAGTETLEELVKKYQESNQPIDCIIYDPFLPWALEVGKKYGIKAATFFTQACAVNYIYYYVHHGMLELPVATVPVEIPGLPALDLPDMPSFIYVHGSYPAYFEMVLSQFSNTDKADFVLVNTYYKLEEKDQSTMRLVADQFSDLEKVDFVFFNTFEKLENEVISWMANRWPIKTIGPANLLLAQKHENHSDAKNYEACTEWLDERETSSVVYVSLGSLVSLKEEQMDELAHGLIMSKCYFLWVVRAEEVHKLPPNFTSLVSEKGLVVNWCSQTEVLSHRSVSCFLTHCGWNSTIEALSYGVPLIAMAHWVDQTTNSKFIEDVWGVGIRVKRGENEIVSREEIAECVKEVSEGEKGKDFRKNAEKWKRLANEAVDDGGTSAVNIEDFVSTILGI